MDLSTEIGVLQNILDNMEDDPLVLALDDIKMNTTLRFIKTVILSLKSKHKEKQDIEEIIRIAREEHVEHIGEFNEGCKLSLDGWFVIDEIEAILLKMKEVGCKQSHEKQEEEE